jgi:hypothetical protein
MSRSFFFIVCEIDGGGGAFRPFFGDSEKKEKGSVIIIDDGPRGIDIFDIIFLI